MTTKTNMIKYIDTEMQTLKTNMYKELHEYLVNMQNKITQDIIASLNNNNKSELIENIKKDITCDMDNKINKQLIAINSAETKKMILTVGNEIQTNVYNKIIEEINVKVVPKVDSMMKWVNHQTIDGDSLINQYRQDLYSPDDKAIMDTNNKNYISPFVRLGLN